MPPAICDKGIFHDTAPSLAVPPLQFFHIASSALAEFVTPQDCVARLAGHIQSMGYTLTATEKATGDTLAVSNVRLTYQANR